MRNETIEALVRTPLHLLVIGGGIVGAGIARDAALRGLRVGLVEQHDFAFGTSSRTSRLLHGGLRYLAQGRLGLVREASVEKRVLHRIAPHLCSPLPFIFPTYRGTEWPHWKLRIGVKLYDFLCGGQNLGNSQSLTPTEVQQLVPGLNLDQLTGAVRYFDGLTNDARLVMDTLRSAANAGAHVINYARFAGAERAPTGWQCAVTDRLTERQFHVATLAIVNATGPWSEQLPHSSVKLRLTKGIHVVLERTRLSVPDAVVMTHGKRILFAIPWGERVIVGTTDDDYSGPIDSPRAEPREIDYLLQIVNQSFPGAHISISDVISTWAGLRPLIADDPNGRPSEISRTHQIRNRERGWWDVAGGKLTTYRLMAEQTVDQIVSAFKRSNILDLLSPHCRTAILPLLTSEQTNGFSGITPPQFGRRAIEHYCGFEWAVHLDDVMVRRTGWHYYFRDAKSKAEQAADWMSDCCGWTPMQRNKEIADYTSQ